MTPACLRACIWMFACQQSKRSFLQHLPPPPSPSIAFFFISPLCSFFLLHSSFLHSPSSPSPPRYLPPFISGSPSPPSVLFSSLCLLLLSLDSSSVYPSTTPSTLVFFTPTSPSLALNPTVLSFFYFLFWRVLPPATDSAQMSADLKLASSQPRPCLLLVLRVPHCLCCGGGEGC